MSEQLDLRETYRTIIDAARQKRYISYGDLAKANGQPWQKVRHEMNRHLGELMEIAAGRSWPMLSAIVVNQNDVASGKLEGSARDGFIMAAKENGFVVDDPAAFVEEQQQAVFDWAPGAPDELELDRQKEHASGESGPRFVAFFGPVLDALRKLGGAAEPKAVVQEVSNAVGLSEKERTARTKNGYSRFENQVGWARFYLARAGLIDNKTRGTWQLTPEGRETHLDQESALSLFREIHARFQTSVREDENDAPVPDDGDSADLFDDPNRRFWFAGASWGGKDQTARFLKEGIWQNGYEEKYAELVASMTQGDRIAIKSSFTKKYGLPFENEDKVVSCMRIKAIGTVVDATSDGKTVKVDWTPLDPPKDWYFFTYRTTIVEANKDEEYARRLILFAFSDQEQDYDYWLRQPYWAKRYRDPVTIPSDVEREKEDAEVDQEEAAFEPYELKDIVSDGCFFSEDHLASALDRLNAKRNLILQGPPGTGKTWLAKRLGYVVIGTRDKAVVRRRMRAIQFHPSLSYEDFVRGWRPDGDGRLSLVDGAFLEAVEAARAERDLPFVVIIEEINRGNPAQIFGEMLTLLERDKRREDQAIDLAYRRETDEQIYIPDNLYVVGTMNIADRSLALVDLALRRRFAFMSLETALNEAWRKWCREEAGIEEGTLDAIQARMTELNEEIANDRTLGAQFKIGHSYVTPPPGERISDARAWFSGIVEAEIAPLLEEYWFDNLDKAAEMKTRLLQDI